MIRFTDRASDFVNFLISIINGPIMVFESVIKPFIAQFKSVQTYYTEKLNQIAKSIEQIEDTFNYFIECFANIFLTILASLFGAFFLKCVIVLLPYLFKIFWIFGLSYFVLFKIEQSFK